MTDLQDLHHAFAELERRADAHVGSDLTVRPVADPRPPAWRRPLLAGATAAVLLGGVAGAVALTSGPDRPNDVAGRNTASVGASSIQPTTVSPSASPTPTVPVATTTTDLERRFGAALAGVATFTVTTRVEDTPVPVDSASTAPGGTSTDPGSSDAPIPPASSGASVDPSGAATDPSPPTAEQDNHDVLIGGVLTAAGGSGGYDVQTAVGWTGPAFCESDTACDVTTLADGSSLAVGSTSVLDADGGAGGGTTNTVCLVRPDGVLVLFHVSNESDPKGMSGQLSAQPPLTTAQMTTVVTSPAWVTG